MIKIPPIRILTPPIRLSAFQPPKTNASGAGKPGGKPATAASPAKPSGLAVPVKPATPGKPASGGTSPAKPASGGTSPAKPASGGTSPAKPASGGTAPQSEALSFESLFSEVLARYLPETVAYTPLGEDVLRATIQNWIRPAYEQAIRDRRERTQQQNAELDADAWARGMGESTYVTDVKSRAYENESRDVSDLESDYASTLAGHLYDAMRAQQEQKVAVDEFNAQQVNAAREHASETALALYNTYLASLQNAQTGGGGSALSATAAQETDAGKPAKYGPLVQSILDRIRPTGSETQQSASVDYKTAANLLARMSASQRADLYAGRGSYAQQNEELLNGLGRPVYEQLQRLFPAK